jgi:hypothetical protein
VDGLLMDLATQYKRRLRLYDAAVKALGEVNLISKECANASPRDKPRAEVRLAEAKERFYSACRSWSSFVRRFGNWEDAEHAFYGIRGETLGGSCPTVSVEGDGRGVLSEP